MNCSESSRLLSVGCSKASRTECFVKCLPPPGSPSSGRAGLLALHGCTAGSSGSRIPYRKCTHLPTPLLVPSPHSHLLDCTSLRQDPLALSFIVRLWGVVGQGFIRGPKHSLSRALASARSSCWISRSQAKSWAWWCLLVVPGLQRWRRRQDRLCSPLPSKPS